MFIKGNTYFSKEVETEFPEPHRWDCSEHGLWMYNLMHELSLNKDGNFDEALKKSVEILEKGKQMENQTQGENLNGEFQLMKAMRGVRTVVNIVKDATNPHFNSPYPKLHQIVSKLDKAVGDYGLEYNQRCSGETIFTKVLHENGHHVVTECSLLNKKGDSQGYGSGQTYAMRYGLCLAFGIAPTEDDGAGAYDDDGNAASARPNNNEQTKYTLDWVLPFKKYKNQKLRDIPVHELKGYAKWIAENYEPNRLTQDHKKFMEIVAEL